MPRQSGTDGEYCAWISVSSSLEVGDEPVGRVGHRRPGLIHQVVFDLHSLGLHIILEIRDRVRRPQNREVAGKARTSLDDITLQLDELGFAHRLLPPVEEVEPGLPDVLAEPLPELLFAPPALWPPL